MRKFARSNATKLRSLTKRHVSDKINGSTLQADKEIFKYLAREGKPSGAVKDPATGEYVFDTNRKFDTMIQQLQKVRQAAVLEEVC